MSDLLYTLGEPAGIGSDIIIQLAQTERLADVVCVGDAAALKNRAEKLGLPLQLLDENAEVSGAAQLRVHSIEIADPQVCGDPKPGNVPAVLQTLDFAVTQCLNGHASAMVTGPLHKGVINDACVSFSGHTEYLAAQTGGAVPVMLLATDSLRVALVTTHLPLKDVSAAISKEKIQQVCRIVHQDFQNRYRIAKPRLLVCGLNPHAGEGGHLGREEIDLIIPALEELRHEGLDIEGPLPADTLFTPKVLERADVAIAMYHDQGLPVLKFHGFGRAANITLGLPIIRTSVDHGTAFDLAGSGQADTGSLKTAISAARRLSS